MKKINTNLDDFRMFDTIEEINIFYIITKKTFNASMSFLFLEFIAQTSAFHTRFLTNFSKQAFLLKMEDFDYSMEKLSGEFIIKATLLAQTDTTYHYEIDCLNRNLQLNGKILISTIEYDENFKKVKIANYYKGLLLEYLGNNTKCT